MATERPSAEAVSGVVSLSGCRNDSRVTRSNRMPGMYTAPSHPIARRSQGRGRASSRTVPAAWAASKGPGADSLLPIIHASRATFSGFPCRKGRSYGIRSRSALRAPASWTMSCTSETEARTFIIDPLRGRDRDEDRNASLRTGAIPLRLERWTRSRSEGACNYSSPNHNINDERLRAIVERANIARYGTSNTAAGFGRRTQRLIV